MALTSKNNLQGKRGFTFILPKASAWTAEATYSAFIDNAADGDIGLFLEDGTLVSTPLVAGNKYFVAQKTPTNVMKTPVMTKGENDGALVYTAPAKQVSTATVTVAATAKGQSYQLAVKDTTDSVGVDFATTIEFVTVTGSETATQIATGIVAAYNAKVAKQQMTGYGELPMFTVSSAGAVITVTAKNFNYSFDVNLTVDNTATAGTIAVTTPMTIGFGTSDQVIEYERSGNIHDGNYITTTDMRDNHVRQGRLTIAGRTYDAISLVSKQGPETKAGSTFETYNYDMTVKLFIETTTIGATGSAEYTAAKAALSL